MSRQGKGKRAREDVESLGEGAWRCLNCDAILSEGDDLGPVLNQHRNQDCRHPESRSRAATRESKCVGCCAALAQVRLLREQAVATAATTPAAVALQTLATVSAGAALVNHPHPLSIYVCLLPPPLHVSLCEPVSSHRSH